MTKKKSEKRQFLDNSQVNEILALNPYDTRERNAKIEKFIEQKLIEMTSQKKAEILDIKEVPPNLIFSVNSIFKVINLKTLATTEFTGDIVSFWATNPTIRKMLQNGEIDAFEAGKFYFKFLKTTI